MTSPTNDPDPGGRTLDDNHVQGLAERIIRIGYAEVANFFTDAEVAEAATQAARRVELGGGEYGAFEGSAGFGGHLLARQATQPRFLELCNRLCRLQGMAPGADTRARQVLRCIAGRSGARHCEYFHFDSYCLTALIPIVMPEHGRSGDLLLFPNFRRSRRSYILNVLEKFVLDRRPLQLFLKAAARRWRGIVRVQLRPGSLYFFNGDRTLHGNALSDAGSLRATLVLHYAETHRDHWLKRLRRRVAARR